MWFKSSFTIPAIAATSFCLIGATSLAAADILHVPGHQPVSAATGGASAPRLGSGQAPPGTGFAQDQL